MDKQFDFWQKWLIYANIMTIGVGLIVAFWGNGIFLEIHNHYSRALIFSGQPFTLEAMHLKNWLFGIIGGTIVGFHVLMLFIIIHPFKNRERWSYYSLWAGLLSWFVIDSSVSWFYGAIHNIILINLVALVLIGVPLVMTRKYFS